MKLIKLICAECNKEFEKSDYSIRAELKKNSNHKFFCCKKCVYAYKTVLKRVKVNCAFCKKENETDENDLKRSVKFFCDKKCYDLYRKIPLEERREVVDLVCPQCNNPFRLFKRSYEQRKREGAKNNYCSSKCSSEAQRNDYSKEFTVKCDYCNKDVIRTGRQLKLTKFHFCNPSCKGSYFARIHSLGEKRSLLEFKLEQHIKNCYPNLKYIVNDRDVLKGLELDFYFPDINFAIEVNGPAHFTPIYGDESLIKTQKHDIIKKTMCKKKHIRLLEITDIIDYNKDNSEDIFKQYIDPILDGLTT